MLVPAGIVKSIPSLKRQPEMSIAAVARVREFEPLVEVVAGDRVVKDFADEHLGRAEPEFERLGFARPAVATSRRRSASANTDIRRLPAEAHRIEHARSRGVREIKRLAFRAEREAELRLREGNEAARRKNTIRRDDEFAEHRRIIAQGAAGDVDTRWRVIMQFDEIFERRLRSCEHFIDHYRSCGLPGGHLPRPAIHRAADWRPTLVDRSRRSLAARGLANDPSPSAATGHGA